MGNRICLLGKEHKQLKKQFTSGNEALDNYLKQQARQDVEKCLCACFLLIIEEEIAGYFTLSSQSIEAKDLPQELKKAFRYRYLPVTLVGRLAVDENYQGKGIGRILLTEALNRSLQATSTIGSIAVVVDPKDERAIGFYAKYGFEKLSNGRMIMMMKDIIKSSS